MKVTVSTPERESRRGYWYAAVTLVRSDGGKIALAQAHGDTAEDALHRGILIRDAFQNVINLYGRLAASKRLRELGLLPMKQPRDTKADCVRSAEARLVEGLGNVQAGLDAREMEQQEQRGDETPWWMEGDAL